MNKIVKPLQNIWEKNWPEIHAGLGRGLPFFLFSSNPKPLDGSVPVFCYHIVDPDRFRGDLEFISENGYTTIDADTLLAHIERRQTAPANSIVITFDDGARNLYETVLPLLQEFEMQAVVFIAPGLHPDQDIPEQPDQPLGWETIQNMHNSGCFDFQAHTLEHRYVPRWPEWIELAGTSYEAIKERIIGPLPMEEDFITAKAVIEERLGKTVKHMAFPKFFGTDNVILMAKHNGYEGFWWGSLPGRPVNKPGSGAEYIVRLEGQFIRRLPGAGRETLRTVLGRRYLKSLNRLTRKVK